MCHNISGNGLKIKHYIAYTLEIFVSQRPRGKFRKLFEGLEFRFVALHPDDVITMHESVRRGQNTRARVLICARKICRNKCRAAETRRAQLLLCSQNKNIPQMPREKPVFANDIQRAARE